MHKRNRDRERKRGEGEKVAPAKRTTLGLGRSLASFAFARGIGGCWGKGGRSAQERQTEKRVTEREWGERWEEQFPALKK